MLILKICPLYKKLLKEHMVFFVFLVGMNIMTLKEKKKQ